MPKCEPEITEEAMAEFLAQLDERPVKVQILDAVRKRTVSAAANNDPSILATIEVLSEELGFGRSNVGHHLGQHLRAGAVRRIVPGHGKVYWAINVKPKENEQ